MPDLACAYRVEPGIWPGVQYSEYRLTLTEPGIWLGVQYSQYRPTLTQSGNITYMATLGSVRRPDVHLLQQSSQLFQCVHQVRNQIT